MSVVSAVNILLQDLPNSSTREREDHDFDRRVLPKLFNDSLSIFLWDFPIEAQILDMCLLETGFDKFRESFSMKRIRGYGIKT
jgi:hypothetical protein